MERIRKQSALLRAAVVSAILSAVSLVLQFLDFSVPLMPHFLKFDFSDLPALIASFAFGPQWGVAVCFLKNLLHFLFKSSTMGIGELSNFLLGAVFTAVAGVIYLKAKNRKGAAIASLCGAAAAGLFSFASNYWLIYPLYIRVLHLSEEKIVGMYENLLPTTSLAALLAAFNIPFTFVKCLAVALLVFFIYKPLSPLLKGRKKEKPAADPNSAG